MIELSAEEAGSALGLPPLLSAVSGVSVDSRTLKKGDLFVALEGERFDGHDYVVAALEAGASGAVVAAGRRIAGSDEIRARGWLDRIYAVENPLLALGRLARTVRRKSRAVVIAVTGSVGKTGTKDLIRAMAGMERVVLATESNLNNEIGVPLTLLHIDPATEVVVVEMGMRGLGQIAYLASLVEPDVGVVTNVAPVHLELLGTIENVAQAKAELLLRMKAEGVAVVPWGCLPLEPWVERSHRRVVRFAFADRGEVGADAASLVDVRGTASACDNGRCLLHVEWPEGEIDVITPFAAKYRLENTVAAAAACYAAGLSLPLCLPGVGGVVFTPGRGDEYEVGGLIILDDSYNASPQAVAHALDLLADRAGQIGGRPVAVLGDMLELGEGAAHFHREAGRKAAEAGVRLLVTVGDYSSVVRDGYLTSGGLEAHARSLAELPAVVEDLKASLRSGDVVLVKGSRRIGLERVVQGLLGLAGGEC